MYKYKIGYDSPEESCYIELEHEQLFTQQQITEMIGDAIKDITSRDQKPRDEYNQNFEHLFSWHDGIPAYLIQQKGFKQITYDMTWYVFGWASVFEEGDWGTYRTERDLLDDLREYLTKQ